MFFYYLNFLDFTYYISSQTLSTGILPHCPGQKLFTIMVSILSHQSMIHSFDISPSSFNVEIKAMFQNTQVQFFNKFLNKWSYFSSKVPMLNNHKQAQTGVELFDVFQVHVEHVVTVVHHLHGHQLIFRRFWWIFSEVFKEIFKQNAVVVAINLWGCNFNWFFIFGKYLLVNLRSFNCWFSKSIKIVVCLNVVFGILLSKVFSGLCVLYLGADGLRGHWTWGRTRRVGDPGQQCGGTGQGWREQRPWRQAEGCGD